MQIYCVNCKNYYLSYRDRLALLKKSNQLSDSYIRCKNCQVKMAATLRSRLIFVAVMVSLQITGVVVMLKLHLPAFFIMPCILLLIASAVFFIWPLWLIQVKEWSDFNLDPPKIGFLRYMFFLAIAIVFMVGVIFLLHVFG